MGDSRIGEEIRRVREARGLSLEDVSSLISNTGVDDPLSPGEIGQMETGKRKVASHELSGLAEVLGSTIGELLGYPGRTGAGRLAAQLRAGTAQGRVC